MSASPTGPAQAAHPNPPPRQAPAQGGSHIGRVLGLLSWIITYGRDLSDKLRQHAGTPSFIPLARRFGTTDLAAILARIARGLMLAAALHERLARRAARGRDLTPPPPRMPKPPKPLTLESPESPPPAAGRKREAHAANATATGTKHQAAPDDVVALPTPKQIAAILRRRPLGTVIADICHDLGIAPGDLGPEMWEELSYTIFGYGGSLAIYLSKTLDRLRGRPAPTAHQGAAGEPAIIPAHPASTRYRPALNERKTKPDPRDRPRASPAIRIRPSHHAPFTQLRSAGTSHVDWWMAMTLSL